MTPPCRVIPIQQQAMVNSATPAWKNAPLKSPFVKACVFFRNPSVLSEFDKSADLVDLTLGIYGDGSDLLLLNGTVVTAGSYLGNGIHHIHAGGHLAESSVLAVQMLGILVHDKELGAGGVGGGASGHGQNAPLVL